MRLILSFLLVCFCVAASAQSISVPYIEATRSMKPPLFVNASQMNKTTSIPGLALVYSTADSGLYYRLTVNGPWTKVGSGGGGGDKVDSVTNKPGLSNTDTLIYWVNGTATNFYTVNREPLITAPYLANYYWNGYKNFVPLNTDSIGEGATNLYFTNARARAAISLTTTGTSGASTYDPGTGILNVPNYNASPGGGMYSIQYNRDNNFAGNSTFVYDTINRYVGIGTAAPTEPLSVDGGNGLPALTAELLSAAGWTSTNWTGSFATGWTHTVGFATTLNNTLAAISANGYRIALTVTGRTAGHFAVSFGGISTTFISTSCFYGIYTTSTASLVITPSTDFNGTILISIKRSTGISTPLASFKSTISGAKIDFRSDNYFNMFIGPNAGANNIVGYNVGGTGMSATRNLAIGEDALSQNVTGSVNLAIGENALRANNVGLFNTAIGSNALAANKGSNNTAIGSSALINNTTGTENIAIGLQSLNLNTTGSNNFALGTNVLFYNNGNQNVAVGNLALQANTTGTGNIGLGYDAGRLTPTGNNTISNYGLYLGVQTRSSSYTSPGPTNEIVIGYQAVGIGSNSVSLGGPSIVKTALRGQIGIGTDAPVSSALLEMVSTTRGVLFPSQTTIQQSAIASPATGLIIQNSNYNNLTQYSGTGWGAIPANHYIAKTATYNAAITDNFIECTANTFTVLLPSAIGLTGKPFTVKNTGGGIITVQANPDGVATLGAITAGSAYTPGTYLNTPLTGGTGSGAIANITVNGAGIVTAVTLTVSGKNYTAGDALSATIPAGSGFSIPVSTLISQTIDGANTYSLGSTYKYISVISNNANFIIVANN